MSHYLHGETAAAFVERQRLAWRPFVTGAAATVRDCYARWRQRRELLDYMDIDHRAAADMGVAGSDARDWARRPFWQD